MSGSDLATVRDSARATVASPHIDALRQAVLHASRRPLYEGRLTGMPEIEDGFPEWFRKLAPTRRSDLAHAQAEVEPSLAGVARLSCTGGTTANPIFIPRSAEDLERSEADIVELYRRARIPRGASVAMLLPFGLWNVGHLSLRAAERAGLTVLPIGTMGSDEASCEILRAFNPRVVYSHPAHVRGLQACLERCGTDPSSIGVTHLLMAGEPFADDEREAAERAWNATVISVYGCEELDGLAAELLGERALTGLPGSFHYEIVALEDHEQELSAGKTGKLLVTSLGARHFPLVRYEPGDLATWVDPDAVSFRLSGRVDEFLILPGATKLYPSDAEAIVAEAGIASRHWQVAERRGRDGLLLEFRFADGLADSESASRRLLDVLRTTIDLGDEVANGYLRVAAVAVEPELLEVTPKGKLLRLIRDEGEGL